MSSNAATFLRLLTTFLILLQVRQGSAIGCFNAIFAFGDSLQDTGNVANVFRGAAVRKLPWGMTYFHKPTGRFSNGRLIIDFIAEAVGLPFVAPFHGGVDFSKGANFAFGGATAIDKSDAARFGLNSTGWVSRSLKVQLNEFTQLLQSKPSLKDPNFLAKSLIMMGEIGGNDINSALGQRMPLEQIKPIIAGVVERISSAITSLIGIGAKNFIVPGNLPVGCIPAWLGQYRSNNTKDYDANGCIKWLNDLAQYQNDVLTKEFDRLSGLHPGVTIKFANYLGSGIRMFSNQKQFGITAPFTACYAGSVCSNPQNYASWEGFHPTEATYSAISDGLIRGPFAIPFLSQKC